MLRNKSGIYIYIYIIINNQDQIYFFKSISKICFFSNYSTPCRNHSYSILRNNRWLHWFEELLSGGKKKGRVPQITYQASLAGRTEPVFLNSAPAENRSNFKPTPLSRTWGHPPVNSSPRPPIDPSEVFDVHSVRGLSRGRRLMTPHTHTQQARRYRLPVSAVWGLKPHQRSFQTSRVIGMMLEIRYGFIQSEVLAETVCCRIHTRNKPPGIGYWWYQQLAS